MANTYSQISIHAVFAVKNRQNLINKNWRDQLHKYISGILTDNKAKSLAVGGWQDHVHIFFAPPVTTSISSLIQAVKASSSKWVNDNHLVNGKFHWQEGYGAFSYSKDQRDNVIKYIMNQEEHHKIKTFKEEYLQLLRDFDIAYDAQYLFEFFD